MLRRLFPVCCVLMVLVGTTALATAPGADPVAGQPPLTKTVVVGNRVRDPDLMVAMKPLVMGKEIVMSAPGPVTVQEAYDVYLKGGNFYDACMPLMWLTCCMGGQFMPGTALASFYNAKEHKAAAYNGVGTAPALMTMDLVRNVLKLQYCPGESDLGGVGAWLRSNLIPMPDSLIAILDRWGTMSWTQAMGGVYQEHMEGTPANVGFANEARSLFTNKNKMTLPIYVETRALQSQAGPNMQQGYLYKREGAARIIREMSNAEQAALAAGASRSDALRAARDEFYKGGFAKAIDQFARDTGGYTRWSDYASYTGFWIEQEDMIHGTFMGIDFYVDSPVSQGPGLIMALNMFEYAEEVMGKSLLEMGYNTAEYVHFITCVYDLVFSDRWHYFGDPNFVDVPKELWTKEYARERVKLIDKNKRFARIPTPGDPRRMKATLDGWREWTLPPKVAGAPSLDIAMVADERVTDTTHGAMLDAAGNLINYTPSDPGPLVPGYGVAIAARARQFTYDPALPSSLAPGKRPCTTPNTWVAVKNGEGYLETQTPGGDEQIPATTQVMLNYLLWGMDPQVAVEQPKFASNNYMSWFTPHIEGTYEPGSTTLARALPAHLNNVLNPGDKNYPPQAVIDGLKAKGHKVDVGNYPGPGEGITLTVRDPKTHVLYAASVAYPRAMHMHYSWGR